MGNLVGIIAKISSLINIVDGVSFIVSKFKKNLPAPKPTPTDCLIDAIELADEIAMKMEDLGFILNGMIADDTNRDLSAAEKLKAKLIEFGLEEHIWDQMLTWHQQYNFGFSSFRDELKILYVMKMTPEQKKDCVIHSNGKNKVKVKLN